MPDTEKLKRKQKPKRGVWRRRRLIAYIIVIGMLSLVLLILLVAGSLFPSVGHTARGMSEFELLSTEIRATNTTLEIQIWLTNTAIAQSTPSP